MKRKTLIQTIAILTSLFCVTTTIAIKSTKNSVNLFQSKASQNEYDLVLNSGNAPTELTDSYQRSVSSTVQTSLGNNLTFTFNNAVSLSGGYAKLGNHGTIYCATDGNDHISGLMEIKAVFTTGSLKILSSYVNGPSFITDEHTLTSNTLYTLPDNANSFILEAQDASVEISSINLKYACQTNTKSFTTTGLYNVEDFENYTADGVGYDSSHNMNQVTNLRARYYSAYYGAGTNPLSGSGWNRMGSTDYLTYKSNRGKSGSACGLFKSNSSNYFLYFQSFYYFGVPNVIGQGAKLSAWMKGAYTGTSADANSSNSATVTLIAYYDKMFNASGSNNAATATYTVAANSDWAQYTVDLDPTKPVYGYGIHIAKAAGTIYLPVDNVEIYTTSPYGNIAVQSVSLNTNSKSLTIGEDFALTASVLPANAADKSVAWSTSNSSVATVTQNGLVHAVAVGNATITATTNDGGHTATCQITVTMVYPGGTYYTTVTISGKTVPIEVILSTRAEAFVYFNGVETDGAQFTEYIPSTGAFTIAISGNATILGSTYSYGNMTGYYRNNQLEDVGLDGSIKNLLKDINNNIDIPNPSAYYWNCDGTKAQLQSTFKRRYRYQSSWSVDSSNDDRITPESVNKSSGTNSLKLRGYSSGIGLSLNSDLNSGNGVSISNINTIGVWIYNPSTSSTKIQIYVFKGANLNGDTAYQCLGTARSLAAQSWTYIRVGFGNLSSGTKIYNFNITNLPQPTADPLIIDDIWFHS